MKKNQNQNEIIVTHTHMRHAAAQSSSRCAARGWSSVLLGRLYIINCNTRAPTWGGGAPRRVPTSSAVFSTDGISQEKELLRRGCGGRRVVNRGSDTSGSGGSGERVVDELSMPARFLAHPRLLIESAPEMRSRVRG